MVDWIRDLLGLSHNDKEINNRLNGMLDGICSDAESRLTEMTQTVITIRKDNDRRSDLNRQ